MDDQKGTGELDPKQEVAIDSKISIRSSVYEAVIRDLMDACDRLMGDSDLPDDESFEMKAMQRAAAILKGGV
jgi:hypothetical protein